MKESSLANKGIGKGTSEIAKENTAIKTASGSGAVPGVGKISRAGKLEEQDADRLARDEYVVTNAVAPSSDSELAAESSGVSAETGRDEQLDRQPDSNDQQAVTGFDQSVPDVASSLAGETALLAQAGNGYGPSTLANSGATATSGEESRGASWWLLGGAAVAIGGGIGVAVASQDNDSESSQTVVSGTVTDGPVQGARLYVDVNGNGTYDEGTDTPLLDASGQQVVTDAHGNFRFNTTLNPASIRLVTHGGIDTVTGEVVTLDFSAPAGYSQINPITSAIAAYMEANPSVSVTEAEAEIQSALGLPDLDYSTVNLADPPAGIDPADILAAQKAAAILATAAIVIEQSGADTDAFQYISENMGSAGSTDAIVTAVSTDSNVAGTDAATQLSDTVTAIEASTTIDAIGDALNDNFFAEVVTSGTLTVGQTVSGEIGLGNTTGLDVAYQWQLSADGVTWTDIVGATGSSYQLTSGESGDHIRLEAVYTDTAGVVQTVYSSDMGIVPVANVAPVMGDYTVSLAENSANGAAVQTVAATDADGNTLSYSITAGNASGAFAINAATGAITVADSTRLDFETSQSFSLTVEASDSSLVDTGTVTVNLTDLNDNIPVITSGGTGSVAENAATSTVIYDAAATDADAGTTITYSLKAITGDVAILDINAATGEVTLGASPDYEAKASYSFTVIASDGTNSSEQAVTVSVVDLNDNPPVITSGDTGIVAENDATGTVIYYAAATDADAGTTITYSLKAATGDVAMLDINATTGEVTLKASADYEAKPSYVFTVIASDGTNSSEQAVTVSVTDLNDNAPVITSGGTGSVAENAATSTVIYDAAATDADAGTIITYSLKPEGPEFSLIDIDSATGEVRLNSSANYENRASYSFTVIASDGTNSSEQAVTVSVTDLNDNTPVIISGGTGSVAENAATSTVIYDAAATDADAGTTITYSLKAATGDVAMLDINATTGAVTLKASADYEAKPSYNFTVIASDGTNSSEQVVTVSVSNVNEHFVVEKSGIWVDLNANGVRDAEDTTAADFTPGTGNVDLTALPAVIHFNNMPNGDLSLAGFGADDLIQIDAQSFIDNGHNALQMLTRPNMITLDEFTAYAAGTITNTGNNSAVVNTFAAISNFVPSISAARQTGTSYHIGNVYPGSNTTLSAMVNLEVRSNFTFTQRTLRFVLSSTSTSVAMQLTGIPADIPLQDLVDFVNVPLPPATVHVLVEREGAVIDIDGDGVRDNGENRLAQFGAGGTADLTGAAPVVIHFNDIPQNALDLTGFGTDDKLEFDIQALQENMVFNSSVTRPQLANLSFSRALTTPTTGPSVSVTVGAGFTFNTNSASVSTPARLNVYQTPGLHTTFNGGGSATSVYALSIGMWTTINGTWSGAFAYWADSGNALNNAANIFPGYTGGNTSAVLATLNSNAPHSGLVDFVWPVHVVVDDQAGNVATFIDVNANGVRDGGEDTLALLGQTQADVDAFNVAAGTGYGSQAVDLAAEQVTIHYNDLPTGAWVPNLTGFNGNDRIEIDLAGMRLGNDTITLGNQPTRTMSSQTQFYAGVSGVSSGNTAAYLSAGNLKFGHRTATPTNTGPSPLFNTYYTATGTLEGTIASNAGALANHFQQVAFVTSVI